MESDGDQSVEYLVTAVRTGNLENVRKYIELLPRVNGCNLLCDAIENHFSGIAKLLLENGVSASSSEGETRIPLISAAESNSTQMIKILLDKGTKIDVQNVLGFTPLHHAVSKGNENIVNLLLQKGANVHVKDKKFKTCIYTAVESRSINMSIISQLLESGADVNSNYSSTSLLHIAVSRGYIPLIRLLLDKGADVNDVRSDGLTALHIAAEKCKLEIAEMLLKLNPNVNSIVYTSKKCCTPLHSAIKGGHHKIVKLLLDQGAKVDEHNGHGKTVLRAAVDKGRSDIVRLVLNQRPDKNNIYNANILRFAITGSGKDYDEIVRVLLQYGFRIKCEGFEDVKMFAEGLQKNYFEIVQQLLMTGYPVNKLSQNKYCNSFPVTPLHHAIEHQCDERVVKLLLDHGADINAKCPFGTPLMMTVQKRIPRLLSLLLRYRGASKNDPSLLISAAYLNDLEVLEILLNSNGSDVNGKKLPRVAEKPDPCRHGCRPGGLSRPRREVEETDPSEMSGGTALHMAVMKGHEDAVNMLLEYGAEVNCQTDKGVSPLRFAAERRLWAIFETLLRFGADVYADPSYRGRPLGYVFEEGSSEILRAFLAYNFAGFTPLRERVLKYLLEHVRYGESIPMFPMRDPEKIFAREILLSHVARLKAANLLTGGEDFVPQKYRDEIANGDFLKNCEAEIVNLKNERFGHAGVSVYDVLTADAKRFAHYIRMSCAMSQISNSDSFERRYPIYASYVKIRLQKRDLRNEYGKRIFETYRLTPSLFSESPLEVVDHILSYLGKQDLKILMDIFKPIEPFHQ